MRIAVKDFQPIGDTVLDAEGLTVIVGPSDRGKSALLRAIESALFNRPGDQFVRVGAKTAKVFIGLRPGDAMSTIEWEKGGGVNKFRVAGEDFSRVGKNAPAPLQALGFKDVIVGAREKDGKLEGGESLRPQFATQFNPEFILDHSGVFIAELLVRVSRLGVVQRAGRLCAADLKAKKALHKTRTQDIATAEARVEKLVDVEPLRERVMALALEVAALVKQQAAADAVRALLAERARLVTLSKLRLPKAVPHGTPDVDLQKLEHLRALVVERARLSALPKLPRVRKASKVAEQALAEFETLRLAVIERRQCLNWIGQANAELERVAVNATALTRELAAVKAAAKVCPVCDRPF